MTDREGEPQTVIATAKPPRPSGEMQLGGKDELEVPADRWVTHLSDADYGELVRSLPDGASVARPWVELALSHPSHFGRADSLDGEVIHAVAVGRALELVGSTAVELAITRIAVIDLDCPTPADADRAVRFARQADPVSAIANRLRLRHRLAFDGKAAPLPPDPVAERRWLRTIGNSFLGACSLSSFENAYSLVRESLDLTAMRQGVLDTPKTRLQSASQSQFNTRPSYTLLETHGSDGAKTFRVSVSLGSLTAQGEGSSLRRAEEEAARALLEKWQPRRGRRQAVPESRRTPGPTISFHDLPADFRRKIEDLSIRLGIPDAAPKLSRAFLHSSYLQERGLRGDGDNSTLAYLGSAVLGVWAADLQLRAMLASADVETLTGPIAAHPWDEADFEAAANVLGLGRLLLVGRAHRDVNPKSLAETFQAVLGALLVEVGEPHAVGRLASAAVSVLKASLEGGWRKAKTTLKERLELTGIAVDYLLEEDGPGHDRRFKADATLASPALRGTLRLKGRAWEKSKRAAEEAAAADVLGALSADPLLITTNQDSNPRTTLQRFVALHECRSLPETRPQMFTWYRRGALGTPFLRTGRLQGFLGWTRLLGEIDERTDADLERFYRACGEVALSDHRSSVAAAARSLIEWVGRLNLEHEDQSVIDSLEFAELLDLAAQTRLLAEPSHPISLRDEVEGFVLLRREDHQTAGTDSIPDRTILGARGSLTLALNRLVTRAWDGSSPSALTLQGRADEDTVIIHLVAEARPSSIETLAQDDDLFSLLCSMVGMLSVTTSAEGVELTLRTIAEVDSVGARYVQAFRSPSEVADPELLEFARLTHDLKNEIIAYAESLRQRSMGALGGTPTIALAYDASRHLDSARAIASGLSARATSFAPPQLDEIDFVSFLRDYLAQMMLSLPPSVRLVTPAAARPLLLMTLPRDDLRSILDNLVKNSIEAMSGRGELRLEWTYVEQERTVMLDITDTGPGLDEDQVASFRRGAALPSTKAGGSGLGLATVRSLVHRMGGEILVASSRGKGTTWTLALPDCKGDRL